MLYSYPYQGVETNTHIVLKTLRVICGIRCALRYMYVLSHKFELYFLALCGSEKQFWMLMWGGGKAGGEKRAEFVSKT